MSKKILFGLFLLFIIGGFVLLGQKTVHQTTNSPLISSPIALATPSTSSVSAVLGIQTKTANCQINGPLPDSACTPGAIFADVTKEQICVAGYAKQVRNVPESEKNQAYAEYGIFSHQTGEYEVDHLISLELGGSNDLANLWPEAAQPQPGFHEKDQLENYLHNQVCNGQVTLEQAQLQISQNWLQIYNQIPH